VLGAGGDEGGVADVELDLLALDVEDARPLEDEVDLVVPCGCCRSGSGATST
jgi:hypothetical protein